MAAREINVELLLNRRVFALNGRNIGRIEEVRVETRRGECLVTEYLVGVFALFERFAAYSIGRAILRTMRLSHREKGYRVAWDQLDLSNLERLRLRCAVEKLRPIERGA
jgi:sporulation protein YlmC with PRC-barrel domain